MSILLLLIRKNRTVIVFSEEASPASRTLRVLMAPSNDFDRALYYPWSD